MRGWEIIWHTEGIEWIDSTTLQSLACVSLWHSRIVVQVLRSRWCDGLRQLGGHDDVIKEYATSGDSQYFASTMVSRLSSLSSPSDLFCRLDGARLAHALVRASRRSMSLAKALDAAETLEIAPMMAVAWIAEMKVNADAACSSKSDALCECFNRLVRTRNKGSGCLVIIGCAHEILANALFPSPTTTKTTTASPAEGGDVEEGFAVFAASGALGAALAERSKYTPRLLAAAQRALRNDIEPVLSRSSNESSRSPGKYSKAAALLYSIADDTVVQSASSIQEMVRRADLASTDLASLAALSFYSFLSQPSYHVAALLHFSLAALECGNLDEFYRRHFALESTRDSFFQRQKRHYSQVMTPLASEIRHAATKL